MSKVCALTGATGLVGSHCAARLIGKGYTVRELQRRNVIGSDSVHFELGQDVAPGVFEGVEALVHCAYDFGPRTWQEIYDINTRGSIKLLQAARVAGVRKMVFISSVSAFEGCRSLYGKAKLLVEEFAKSISAVIIRPGLVFGDPRRGMYGALCRIARFPILPVFSGGTQPFFMVHVDDLAMITEMAISSNLHLESRTITAAHPVPVQFRAILRSIAEKNNRKLVLLSVPSGVALRILRILEYFGIPLSFRSDSLLGMLYPNREMDFAATEELKFEFRGFTGNC